MSELRGEMGQAGTFGYVAVSTEATAEQISLVRAIQVPRRVIVLGHEALQSDKGEPYTEFSFVVTRADEKPGMQAIIPQIAESVTAIMEQDGSQVAMDDTVYEVGRGRYLFRDRTPADPARREALLRNLGQK